MLGEGGFAVVHLATDLMTGGQVAVKILKDPSDDRETALRFQREVQIVGTLRSEHSVALHGHGALDTGELYAVFEYVAGSDLGDLLKEHGRFDRATVIKILRQLLGVLDEAHRRGLLHRDIKPQNIRVVEGSGDAWKVKLLDWGIARIDDGAHPSVTATGIALGTPRYMSPEQLRALPLTAASDIYSLGLVGIEMLAGADALPGSAVAHQLERLRTGHVVNIPLRDPEDVALAATLQRFTTVHANERVSTAAAAIRALDDLEHPSQAHTLHHTPTVRPRTTEPAKSRRSLTVIAALALVVLAAVVALTVLRSMANQPAQTGGLSDLPRSPVHNRAVPDVEPVDAERHPRHDAASPAADAAVDSTRSVYGSSGCSQSAGVLDAPPHPAWLRTPRGYHHGAVHPLLIVVQDKWDEVRAFVSESGLGDLADREGVLVAAIAKRQVWRDTDAPDLRQLFDDVAELRCVDRRRVYVLANRSGSRAVLPISCAPWVTAIALNAITFGEDHTEGGFWPPACPDGAPRPAIVFTPLDSPRITIDGTKPCDSRDKRITLESLEMLWRTQNGCEPGEVPYETNPQGDCVKWSCDATFVACRHRGGSLFPGVSLTSAASFAQKMTHRNCPAEPAASFPTVNIAWRFFQEAPVLPIE